MNVTPNSFSDGGEFFTTDSVSNRLNFLKQFDAIDIGAESTAPQNSAISWQSEWERWQMVLPHLKALTTTISVDSYHPETIFELVKYWKDNSLRSKLIWNDVSGKFDESVRDYLKSGHDYIFCHNLAPSRDLTGKHMDYVALEIDLYEYFHHHCGSQIIFDPCLGFSKTFEQNWEILKCLGDIQNKLQHFRWLVGFSRKSFLRKKYGTENIEELDHAHTLELKRVLKSMCGEVWIRTHRPELLDASNFVFMHRF